MILISTGSELRNFLVWNSLHQRSDAILFCVALFDEVTGTLVHWTKLETNILLEIRILSQNKFSSSQGTNLLKTRDFHFGLLNQLLLFL